MVPTTDVPSTDELIAALALSSDTQLSDMEQKVKEAYARMRELDSVLTEKQTLEKQVVLCP